MSHYLDRGGRSWGRNESRIVVVGVATSTHCRRVPTVEPSRGLLIEGLRVFQQESQQDQKED